METYLIFSYAIGFFMAIQIASSSNTKRPLLAFLVIFLSSPLAVPLAIAGHLTDHV